MTVLRLADEVYLIPQGKIKRYFFSYNKDGFEIGVGKSGHYKGHSHLYFYDIIYSPGGISYVDRDGQLMNGKLIVVPPRTYLQDLTTFDFYFIKFCSENRNVIVPDKIDLQMSENIVRSFTQSVNLEFLWYPGKDHIPSKIVLNLYRDCMIIKIGLNKVFKIVE